MQIAAARGEHNPENGRAEDAENNGRERRPALPDAERAFRFSRMFAELAAFAPADDGLIALGKAMEDTPNFKDHPDLPAGFTYFGQFLDHDITFDKTDGLPSGQLSLGTKPLHLLRGGKDGHVRGAIAKEAPITAPVFRRCLV